MAGTDPDRPTDPHGDQPIRTAGAPLDGADAAVVCLHGRGATARSILGVARELATDEASVAYLAPQAARNTWYPNGFMEPIESNEPWLASALSTVERAIDEATGAVPLERTMVLGFSQGACLGSEYVARNATRYGGVVAFSGGLIGPEGTPRDYGGSLDGTPAFVGCSDRDPHIPVERVHETTRVIRDLDAEVTERIYEGMGHGVNEDELEHLGGMIRDLAGG